MNLIKPNGEMGAQKVVNFEQFTENYCVAEARSSIELLDWPNKDLRRCDTYV